MIPTSNCRYISLGRIHIDLHNTILRLTGIRFQKGQTHLKPISFQWRVTSCSVINWKDTKRPLTWGGGGGFKALLFPVSAQVRYERQTVRVSYNEIEWVTCANKVGAAMNRSVSPNVTCEQLHMIRWYSICSRNRLTVTIKQLPALLQTESLFHVLHPITRRLSVKE
jgi:hypothetical protein